MVVPSARWKRVRTSAGALVGLAMASRVSKNAPVAPSARYVITKPRGCVPSCSSWRLVLPSPSGSSPGPEPATTERIEPVPRLELVAQAVAVGVTRRLERRHAETFAVPCCWPGTGSSTPAVTVGGCWRSADPGVIATIFATICIVAVAPGASCAKRDGAVAAGAAADAAEVRGCRRRTPGRPAGCR